MKKSIGFLAMTAILTLSSGQTAFADWEAENGSSRYYYADGTMAADDYIDGEYIWSDGSLLGEENAAWTARCYVKCNEFITLREEPSTSGNEICKIPKGQKIEVLEEPEEGAEFVKVKYREQEGYVMGAYLTSNEVLSSGVRPMKVVNCNESITLRELPGSASREIMQIPKGASVIAMGEKKQGFHRIAYQKRTEGKEKEDIFIGWAMSRYLEIDQEAEANAERAKAERNKAERQRTTPDKPKETEEAQETSESTPEGETVSGDGKEDSKKEKSEEKSQEKSEENPEKDDAKTDKDKEKDKKEKDAEDKKEKKKDKEDKEESEEDTEETKEDGEEENGEESGKKKKKKFQLPKIKLPKIKLPKIFGK